MPELLPCPFCGGEAEIRRYGDTRKSTIVGCVDCHCEIEGPETFNHGTQWNTRHTTPDPLRDAAPDLYAALEKIQRMTDADDDESYRADDREGCLDAVYGTAETALAKARGDK